MKLTIAQKEKNEAYAKKHGYKLDEHGRVVMKENAKLTINARIEEQKDEN